MAIEIIPKKAEIKNITLVGIVFHISLILLIATVLISVLLFVLQINLNRNIVSVAEKINAIGTSEELALEKKVILIQKKINDFEALLNSHWSNAKFFTNLENLTHPKISFSEADLQIGRGRAVLSGTTDNFEILGQQFLIFEKEDYIKGVNLLKTSINKDGKIEFVFETLFDSAKFKY